MFSHGGRFVTLDLGIEVCGFQVGFSVLVFMLYGEWYAIKRLGFTVYGERFRGKGFGLRVSGSGLRVGG